MLIRLLLDDAETRADVIEQLHSQDLVAEMDAAPVISELVRLHDAGETVDVVALSEKLPPPMQRALAEVTMDGEARPVSFLEISAYLNALERRQHPASPRPSAGPLPAFDPGAPLSYSDRTKNGRTPVREDRAQRATRQIRRGS